MNIKNTKKHIKKGFTLIELLVVIAIIGILSTIVLASLGESRDKAIQAKVLAEVRSMQTAFAILLVGNGSYPNPGNVAVRNCLAQNPCYDGGAIVPPFISNSFSGELPRIPFATKTNNDFKLIHTAEAETFTDVVTSYPSNTPEVIINGLKYSGPFYVCNQAVGDRCTSASYLWTTKESTCTLGGVVNGLSGSGGSLCGSDAADPDNFVESSL